MVGPSHGVSQHTQLHPCGHWWWIFQMEGFFRERKGWCCMWDIVEKVNPCAGLTGVSPWLGCHQNSTDGSLCHFSWPKKHCHHHHQSDQELRDTTEPLITLHSLSPPELHLPLTLVPPSAPQGPHHPLGSPVRPLLLPGVALQYPLL